jgi:hypothetical protein
MSMRPLFIACLLAASAAAFAQSASTPTAAASDSWNRPATAGSVAASYRDGSTLKATASKSHFKFKESRDTHPQRNAALEASGKAPVAGGNEIGRDGRPTVSCAQTPMDPACH